MAALTMVMVLFLIMAMVAAYTNRNLVFEQRTAANSYRSERALSAADSAVDWALSMLNGGQVGTDCELDSNAASSYRDTLLAVDGDGRLTPRMGPANLILYSGCINVDGILTCGCPTTAQPAVTVASAVDPPGSAFRVNFFQPGAQSRAGAIGLNVQGCGTPGLDGGACVSSAVPQVDGLARVIVTLGMVRALPSAPAAALTAADSVNAAGQELRIGNPDALTGFTVHTGNGINAATTRYAVPAGSAGTGVIDNDPNLRERVLTNLAQVGTTADTMFIATFGMDGPSYSRQQAVVRKTCDTPCDMTDLDFMLAMFPGRTFWFDGDLNINAATGHPSGTIGTVGKPALVITTGTLTVQAANPMFGLFYASAINWNAAGATVRGAVISASNFNATANTTITYDPTVINTLVTAYGNFVRTPGSWNRPSF
ncbi:pilus assembly PilX N-terminal domain-containing protein [Aquabacterium sp. OR-4]|uniref:pilus assembly PilX N-terminal domain-containing protein n=1 Tax=Aquabacterium sp. OR-4 TaxID=2978127 RepID=UPI0021B4B6D6|nr:pilus assembly PilX N-terminal domain-containing protein [Aquabacterium sp. OR-4]MDT7836352.1 pilus assembly PilX N-terminal domain-containing protein [Aquabacterium sp. OR-4]